MHFRTLKSQIVIEFRLSYKKLNAKPLNKIFFAKYFLALFSQNQKY